MSGDHLLSLLWDNYCNHFLRISTVDNYCNHFLRKQGRAPPLPFP